MEGSSSTTLGVAAEPAPNRPEATPLTAATTTPAVTHPAPAWPRSAQWASAALLLLALGLLGWQALGALRWGSRPTELDADAAAARIDLNRADRAQLLQLPGVGDITAQRIEEYRQSHHGFQSVEELRRVHGVGPALLERLRPLVEVEPSPPAEEETEAVPPAPDGRKKAAPKAEAARKVIGSGKKEENLAAPIDVNRASAAELQQLPGIGPALSGRILQARERQPFRTVEELRRVPGIGPKTLEHLRPFVVVNDEPRQP